MKNTEDPRLLAHMRRVQAQRRDEAINRTRRNNNAAMALIAGRSKQS